MLLGISGKARSGKNTVCDMILYCIWCNETKQTKFSYSHFVQSMSTVKLYAETTNLSIKSFAYLLKRCISIFIPSSIEQYEYTDFKNLEIEWLDNMSIRELLQQFGTAIRNGVCKDFWVKALFATYNNRYDWLISDVRFKSEAEAIKSRNGIIIRINRKGVGAGNHISETDLDDYNFDYTITNNDSLDELLIKVKELCINLKLI